MEDYKKKYEDAVKELKKFFISNDDRILYKHDIERVFPELKESEDEKIRKSLIELIKGITSWNYFLGISKEQMIDWLEKQDIKLQVYINNERNKKDFYCEGKEMSWNDMSINVRKHDYPYYFKGDLDCYPFNIEKQSE